MSWSGRSPKAVVLDMLAFMNRAISAMKMREVLLILLVHALDVKTPLCTNAHQRYPFIPTTATGGHFWLIIE